MKKSTFLGLFIIACIGIFGQTTFINTAYGINGQECVPGAKLGGTYSNDSEEGKNKDVFVLDGNYLYCDDEQHAKGKIANNNARSSCESGTLVYFYQNGKPYYTECVAPNDGQDYWAEKVEVRKICDNSPIKKENGSNTIKVLKLGEDKNPEIKNIKGATKIVGHGYNYCLWIVCDDGYFLNNSKCDANSVCTSGGGTVKNGKCTCSSNRYEWNGTRCVKTAAAQAADANAAAAQNRSNKEKCEASGGTWTGKACTCSAENNMQAKPDSKYECMCVNGYDFNSSNKKCEMNNEELKKQLCERAQNATWDELLRKCKCDMPHSIFNYSTGECEQNQYFTACGKIPGAHWVDVPGTDGECICYNTKLRVDYQKMACVESEEAQAAAAALRITQEQKQSRNEITGAVSKIKSLQDSFKKTVWKNEDGKFNTSRLASDLTAAVVLGTTGALVTSNVIKKNQVNNGFDDISCTIGGQRVADWGDQFRVGVK